MNSDTEMEIVEFRTTCDFSGEILTLAADADIESAVDWFLTDEYFPPNHELEEFEATYVAIRLGATSFEEVYAWAEEQGLIQTDPREIIAIFQNCNVDSMTNNEGRNTYIISTKIFENDEGDDSLIALEYSNEIRPMLEYYTFEYFDSIDDYLIFRKP